jgi:hypothetical protein
LFQQDIMMEQSLFGIPTFNHLLCDTS